MAATPEPGADGNRVVVGVDGSVSSLHALDWAADQAARTGARLEIVAAWDWPSSYGWAVPIPEDYNPGADAERMLSGCRERVQRGHRDLQTTTRAVQGHPALVLVDASRGAALLVVGSRGHGEFAGMLLGSVGEHCATNAHCPVLVFRGGEPAA